MSNSLPTLSSLSTVPDTHKHAITTLLLSRAVYWENQQAYHSRIVHKEQLLMKSNPGISMQRCLGKLRECLKIADTTLEQFDAWKKKNNNVVEEFQNHKGA